VLIGLIFLAALLLAYANGANDNFKATATIYGSGTLGYRSSLGLATVAQISGSVASVFLAGALVSAFSGKGLVPDATVASPAFIFAVGTGAAATVLVATRFGLPISTTHALVGGLVGAGFALSPAELNLSVLGTKYFLPLLSSPLIAFVAATILYPLASRARRSIGLKESTCICVEGCFEPVEVSAEGTMVLAHSGLAITIAEQDECTQRYIGSVAGVSAQTVVDILHGISAFALGFARGLNDTPKVFALLVAASWTGFDPRGSLAVIAVAMAAGGLLHSRRLAETLGHNITEMNHGQGLVANAVASSLVIGASLLGSPVSTTHVSTGGIFGIGIWSGRTSWALAGGIVLAWVATLPLGAAIAFGLARVVGGI